MRNVCEGLPLTTDHILYALEALNEFYRKGRTPRNGPTAYLRGILKNVSKFPAGTYSEQPTPKKALKEPAKAPSVQPDPRIREAVRNLCNNYPTGLGDVPHEVFHRLLSNNFISVEEQWFFPKKEYEYFISPDGQNIHVELKGALFAAPKRLEHSPKQLSEVLPNHLKPFNQVHDD